MDLRLLSLFVIFIQYAQSQSLNFTVEASQLCNGETASLNVIATLYNTATPVIGANITLVVTDGNGTSQSKTQLSDQNGAFAYDFGVVDGTYTITGSYVALPLMEFAQWTVSGNNYTGILAGNIVVTVTASNFIPNELVYIDLSNTTLYCYPGSSSTQAIMFQQDALWQLQMNTPVSNLLLYASNWAVNENYNFSNAPWEFLSPFPTSVTTNPLDYADFFPYNYDAPVMFSGLLQFPGILSSLSIIDANTGTPSSNTMTIALVPEGQVSVPISIITCSCQPASTSLNAITVPKFIADIWAFAPMFQLVSNGTPLPGLSVTLTYQSANQSDTCTGTTDSNGNVGCQFTKPLITGTQLSLQASYYNDGCDYQSATSSNIPISVFGFGDPHGAHAFTISNKTNITLGAKVTFSGISLMANIKSFNINQITQINGGVYANASLNNNCSGTFNWTLAPIPTAVPSMLGVLVADKFLPSSTYKKIIILANITYHNTTFKGFPGVPLYASMGTVVGVYCP